MSDINETLQDRKSTHGDFTDHSSVAQKLKRAAYEGKNTYQLVDFEREAIDMILHKIARIMTGNPHHADHWHDIIGYAKLVEDRLIQNDTK